MNPNISYELYIQELKRIRPDLIIYYYYIIVLYYTILLLYYYIIIIIITIIVIIIIIIIINILSFFIPGIELNYKLFIYFTCKCILAFFKIVDENKG